MSFNEHLSEFHGLSVIELTSALDWKGPGYAYRIREEYDADDSIIDLLKLIIEQPDSNQLTALIIGAWTKACEGDAPSSIVESLIVNAAKLPSLKHLFMGEMTYEECEVSWIIQTDQAPLLKAFPLLESLKVRGGSNLEFSKIKHENLKELAVETGGLSTDTLSQILLCDFPNLTDLELLLGDEGYGFDGSIEDLQPVFSGKLFPKLKHLGLMNSVITDEIVAVIVNSSVIYQLETLDLSMGTLTDEGANSLLALADIHNLKTLNINHHYVSEEMLKKLKATLPFEIIADESAEQDDDFRGVMHSE